jgi:hypothetical protein
MVAVEIAFDGVGGHEDMIVIMHTVTYPKPAYVHSLQRAAPLCSSLRSVQDQVLCGIALVAALV